MNRAANFALGVALGVALGACTEDGSVREPNGQFYFAVDLDEQSPRLMGRGVAAVGDIIYVVTPRQLRIVVGNIGIGFEQPRAFELHPDGSADGHALVPGDGVLYVGDRFGVSVFDLAVPDVPELLGRLPIPQGIHRLARHGTMLVAATHDNTLAVVDITDPRTPTLQGSLALTGSSKPIVALELDGATAHVGAFGALWIVDVTNRAAPALVAHHPLPLVGDFVRHGSLLYTGNADALSILDISDPQNPLPVGPADAPWRLYSVAPVIEGNRLFMADYEIGDVYVLDISSPTRPSVERVLRARSEAIPTGYVQDMTFANQQLWQTHVGGMFSWVIDF